MPTVKLIVAIAACFALFAGGRLLAGDLFRASRVASSDLEITGIAPDTVRYVSYQHLLNLPHVTVTVTNDDNFRGLPHNKLSITGIYLDVLANALGAPRESDLITALCSDGYRTSYSREYLKTHRPLLALEINGRPVQSWVTQTHNDNPGPYFITHESFKPSFSILSLPEMPKIPARVIRLEFGSAQQTYRSITPGPEHAADPQITAGFRIAQRNCYRCHNSGNFGGTKAGKSWSALGNYAAASPSAFEHFIRSPKSVNLKSPMPSNPDLDETSAKALQAYFQTFAAGDRP